MDVTIFKCEGDTGKNGIIWTTRQIHIFWVTHLIIPTWAKEFFYPFFWFPTSLHKNVCTYDTFVVAYYGNNTYTTAGTL